MTKRYIARIGLAVCLAAALFFDDAKQYTQIIAVMAICGLVFINDEEKGAA